MDVELKAALDAVENVDTWIDMGIIRAAIEARDKRDELWQHHTGCSSPEQYEDVADTGCTEQITCGCMCCKKHCICPKQPALEVKP